MGCSTQLCEVGKEFVGSRPSALSPMPLLFHFSLISHLMHLCTLTVALLPCLEEPGMHQLTHLGYSQRACIQWEYYSAVNRKGILAHAMTWRKLDEITGVGTGATYCYF